MRAGILSGQAGILSGNDLRKMTGDPQVPCFLTIYKFERSFISIQKFECIIITLCVKTCGILDKEKNNYVFSCIEYLQSMKPYVEPIKKKKKLDCF